jgi:hypothetical protein
MLSTAAPLGRAVSPCQYLVRSSEIIIRQGFLSYRFYVFTCDYRLPEFHLEDDMFAGFFDYLASQGPAVPEIYFVGRCAASENKKRPAKITSTLPALKAIPRTP